MSQNDLVLSHSAPVAAVVKVAVVMGGCWHIGEGAPLHRWICKNRNGGLEVVSKASKTRPDTWHKMRLVCVLFTLENKTGRTYGRTDRPTDRRTDTTSYRDATAHLKRTAISCLHLPFSPSNCFRIWGLCRTNLVWGTLSSIVTKQVKAVHKIFLITTSIGE